MFGKPIALVVLQVRHVTASGIRIFTPDIPGVGKLRIRYPVMPFHEEGNNIYKNLMALQEITMDMSAYTRMLEKPPGFAGTVSYFITYNYIPCF